MSIVQWIIYLFIFFLPTQLGKHFFFPFSFIDGLRIDYLAPTLYITDLIALTFIFFQFKKLQFSFSKKYIILFVLVMLNIIFSLSPWITLYKFVKALEIILIFSCIQIKLNSKYILISLISSAAIQLCLSILQISSGKSVQGLFYFLGERYFSLATPGIAKIAIQGLEVLRGYGTFSHPNSLGGFYLFLYSFVLLEKRFNRTLVLKYIFLGISSLLIFVSFSKIAIMGFLLINAFYIYRYVPCKLCSTARIVGLLVLTSIFFSFQGDPASIAKRIQLMKDAMQIIVTYPVMGTGFGAYLIAQSTFPNTYSYFFLQPVHNIFSLLLAELGIPFFLYICYLSMPYLKKIISTKITITLLAVILFTGLFDHYWLTLQQNILLLPVIFGLLKNQKWS